VATVKTALAPEYEAGREQSEIVQSEPESLEEATASMIMAAVEENSSPTEADRVPDEKKHESASSRTEDMIVDRFFEVENKSEKEDAGNNTVLAQQIEESLKALMAHSCFDIDVVEVDVVDNTALIFIDGEDAALLIGKEGYRYNALSYMLFNWLHAKHRLYVKLEIAEFLTSQQEMIRNYIQPVVESVKQYGKGKTRFLDGILVQIALEQLRDIFPDKYVAIKRGKSGKRFVVINEFHNRSHG